MPIRTTNASVGRFAASRLNQVCASECVVKGCNCLEIDACAVMLKYLFRPLQSSITIDNLVVYFGRNQDQLER